MKNETRMILAAAVALLGLSLMICAALTGISGLLVVGLCSAAAATREWMVLRKQEG